MCLKWISQLISQLRQLGLPFLWGQGTASAAKWTDIPRDALGPYPWFCSISWCLVEGCRSGDQRCSVGLCVWRGTLLLLYTPVRGVHCIKWNTVIFFVIAWLVGKTWVTSVNLGLCIWLYVVVIMSCSGAAGPWEGIQQLACSWHWTQSGWGKSIVPVSSQVSVVSQATW